MNEVVAVICPLFPVDFATLTQTNIQFHHPRSCFIKSRQSINHNQTNLLLGRLFFQSDFVLSAAASLGWAIEGRSPIHVAKCHDYITEIKPCSLDCAMSSPVTCRRPGRGPGQYKGIKALDWGGQPGY